MRVRSSTAGSGSSSTSTSWVSSSGRTAPGVVRRVSVLPFALKTSRKFQIACATWGSLQKRCALANTSTASSPNWQAATSASTGPTLAESRSPSTFPISFAPASFTRTSPRTMSHCTIAASLPTASSIRATVSAGSAVRIATNGVETRRAASSVFTNCSIGRIIDDILSSRVHRLHAAFAVMSTAVPLRCAKNCW